MPGYSAVAGGFLEVILSNYIYFEVVIPIAFNVQATGGFAACKTCLLCLPGAGPRVGGGMLGPAPAMLQL